LPKASVITPLYNGAAHIVHCIESVAAQTMTDLEHIVIDNNSTDDGPSIVRDLQDKYPHITLISETAPGPGPARNAGIRHASGRYIAFLDADDAWKPAKLSDQISAMQETGACFSWTTYDVIKDGAFARIQGTPSQARYADLLAKRVTIGCLTAVYDAELLGKMFMNDLPMRQDYCLWLDILSEAEARSLPVLGLPRSLAVYNVHDAGLTADKRKAARMQWRAYRDHVGLSRVQTARNFASYALRGVLARLKPSA
jgi:glycosyltransferase involved in cell wall biosynthesis